MTGANDPNPFHALTVGNKYNVPPHCTADSDFPALGQRVIRIRKGRREGVQENRERLLKGHAMLLTIRRCFPRIPLKNHTNQV